MFLAPYVMHIPDNFLSLPVAICLWLVTIVVLAQALKRVGADLGERQVPLMGVLAAAIFAGQMINFPVMAGASGHLMGAAIATILIGPWAAILAMTSVVAIQALIFQDGGLLVLGANIFNMGIVGVAIAYFAYRLARKLIADQRLGIFVGGFAAAWLSVFITSLAVALQLALSGSTPANLSIPAMGAVHALIGIGEGLITVGALAFIYNARRDLILAQEEAPRAGALVWISGLGLALLLTLASPWASTHPDGLEWVAGQQGFLEKAGEPFYKVIPDYVMPGISNESLATIAAGIVGVLLVFGATLLVAWSRRKNAAGPDHQH